MTTRPTGAYEVVRSDVRFDSAGIELAGQLYLPALGSGPQDASLPETLPETLPGVVVGHPGSGVKEQAAGLYARLLAERGIATLAFDAAFQGESGGLPRDLEDPAHRVEDFKAAVSYLTSRGDIDPARIGGLGICASGGYLLSAAAGDQRITAVATVSAVDMTRQYRLGADGTQDPAVFQRLLTQAAAARTAEATGAETQRFTLFPASAEQARTMAGEHGFDGYDYYRTPRGEHPRAMRHKVWRSIDLLVGYDSFSAVPLLSDRPLLMIAGRRAVTGWMSIEAYQRHDGAKEFVWIEGASHVDLYDKPEYVAPAIDALDRFFVRELTKDADRSAKPAS